MSEPATTSSQTILQTVERYYADCLEQFGPTPRGVDWNSQESQHLRFDRLLEVVDREDAGSILDVGCGYGALADYLSSRGSRLRYVGYDISPAMIAAARSRHPSSGDCAFTSTASELPHSDYAVASGIFNVKLQHPVEQWREYVMETLTSMNHWSGRAFAFNMLSLYSDANRRKNELYYVDPREMFDVCKRQFSPRVALLHDYPLYEFTIIVRK